MDQGPRHLQQLDIDKARLTAPLYFLGIQPAQMVSRRVF
jgi:hypothetical protein